MLSESAERLLTFSELSTLITELNIDHYKLNKSKINLFELASLVKEETMLNYNGYQTINIQIDIPEQDHFIEADSKLLMKIIGDVVHNSIRFGREEVNIKIQLQKDEEISPFIVAGVFCGDRIQEYGVASKPDYKKRGSKAKAYSRFVIEHLLPTLSHRFRVDLNHPQNAIAGYSMGGLSAMDIAWNHPEYFPRMGAFSGSFWWRKKGLDQGYSEHDRIIHGLIRKSRIRKGMKFWFMAGTEDEKADRNKNGIIDAIDDTLDLIAELIKLGYKPYYDVAYYEVKGGKHDVPTWGRAMPEFLKWAYGK